MELLESAPNDKVALYQLGDIYLNQANKFAKAVEFFTRGFIYWPKEPEYIQGFVSNAHSVVPIDLMR